MVLSIRVIQLTLENGVREILLTTLLDADRFPYTDFQGLYAKRWGSETHYDVLKNILEIENFTGTSPLTVRQDFYATVLTNNIRGLIHWELQDEVAQENQNSTRMYAYQLNKNLSIGRLKDRIVTLLLDQGNLQEFYADLKREMKRNMIPIRPGRQFPRTRKNRQKYTMTKRRAL
ncbi:transposase ISLbp1 [Candidatus Vecturithrix granuli]|uniref:Transposase ISLbp1 n=1 Tax=Vecturithrix granuli TaxID=1499967 RepID=A0A081BW58_VECG1|nr:transposase ISLbp1 [Candidatus Vecturithrix granuli]